MLCKIWSFHGGDYEICRLLGYKTPVRTSQEKHYVSATEPSQLMLCNIWGFHEGDYEEWRLLGYKSPVHTSQETHYVSATESSQLTLCKIWGFHGGDYDECSLLGRKNPVRTSQEKHYVSATEPSRLMLCKICGFHGGIVDWKIYGICSPKTHCEQQVKPLLVVFLMLAYLFVWTLKMEVIFCRNSIDFSLDYTALHPSRYSTARTRRRRRGGDGSKGEHSWAESSYFDPAGSRVRARSRTPTNWMTQPISWWKSSR
jgi:hypothetical protein